MNYRKLKLEKIKEIALKYNAIVGEYSPATLLEMSKQQLITLIYQWTRLTTEQIEYYVYKDIKKYLYKLEGQWININYEVTKIDDSLSSPFIIPVKETVRESYKIQGFRVLEKLTGVNKLDNKVEQLWQTRDYTAFKGDKLNAFYKEFMKLCKEKSILQKLKEIEV